MVSTYHHQNTKSIICQRETCVFKEIIKKYNRLSKYLFLLELFLLEIKVLDVNTQTLEILTGITKTQYNINTKTQWGNTAYRMWIHGSRTCTNMVILLYEINSVGASQQNKLTVHRLVES